jgi:hypothetical protein
MTTGTASPDVSEGRLGTVLRLLTADAPSQVLDTPQTWPRWTLLLPHLLSNAAVYLWVHARFAEGRRLAERALAIAEASYSPDHRYVIGFRANLAAVLAELEQ